MALWRFSGNEAETNLDLENHGHLLVRVRFLTGGAHEPLTLPGTWVVRTS